MGFNLKPNQLIYLWLALAIIYMGYNEFLILPYQSWTPESMTTMYEMSLRNPLINLGLVMGAFGIMSYGTIVYVTYNEKNNSYRYETILTDQSTMKDSQKGSDGYIKTSNGNTGKIKG